MCLRTLTDKVMECWLQLRLRPKLFCLRKEELSCYIIKQPFYKIVIKKYNRLNILLYLKIIAFLPVFSL
ncbi:hypothetical protein EV210_11438 [Anaerospora hongkongensis]|uniref:Uncharacterized protein n=1 Tax=Anaerospora hongkongensis TaxID=244830 RepID=A0A4R1PTC3_9FIRM|nr:hypothetical protein EV210_11438 [Anaerospora hongkongensis]